MSSVETTQRYQLVAVPQPKTRTSAKTSYSLGVRSTNAGAGYVIGTDGPEHRAIEKIYFANGDKEFMVDVVAKTLTVADKATMRVTIYPVDVNAMNGQVIEHGETFTVVLADAGRSERPLHVDRWVAATSADFERDTLPDYVTTADDIAISISATTKEAEQAGHVKVKNFETTAAISAGGNDAVIDIRMPASDKATSDEIEVIVDAAVEEGLDLDNDDSIEVVVPDPVTGARYRGRQWKKSRDQAKTVALTLAALRAAEFRVVILELENGKSATIALNDANGLPVMSITSKPGAPQINRYLTADTWNERFGPGTPLHFRTHSTFEGKPAPERGDLSTAPITRITATNDFVRDASKVVNVEVTDALARHRKLVAANVRRHDKDSLVRVIGR